MDDYAKDERFLARWLAGELSEKELAQFQAHPDFPKYQQLIKDANSLKVPPIDEIALLNKIKSHQEYPNKMDSQASIFQLLGRIFIPAASVLFLLSIYMSFIQTPATNIFTKAGQQKEYILPDQSKVALNANTQITFNPYEYNKEAFDQKRIVQLFGEAFFDVQPGSSFQVFTDNGYVTVLGTSFSVRSNPQEFLVSCKTGQVKVENYSEKEVNLNKGERVRLRDTSFHLKEKIDPSIIASWKDGESKFKSEPLYNVVRALQKQFDVKIETDTSFINEKFTGSFIHQNIETALKMVFIPMEMEVKKKKEDVYFIVPKK